MLSALLGYLAILAIPIAAATPVLAVLYLARHSGQPEKTSTNASTDREGTSAHLPPTATLAAIARQHPKSLGALFAGLLILAAGCAYLLSEPEPAERSGQHLPPASAVLESAFAAYLLDLGSHAGKAIHNEYPVSNNIQAKCLGKDFGADIDSTAATKRPRKAFVARHAWDQKEQARGPFKDLPPELAAISRGLVKGWEGAYINNGHSGYTGVDLDTGELYWIFRQSISDRADHGRRYVEPKVPEGDHTTELRKWTSPDGRFRQTELVHRTRLDRQELEAFVCAANVEWQQPWANEAVASDTLYEFATLRVPTRADGKEIVEKPTSTHRLTAEVLSSIIRSRRW